MVKVNFSLMKIMLDTNIYGRPFDDLGRGEVRNEAIASYQIFLLASSDFLEVKTSDVLFAEVNLIKNRLKRDIVLHLIRRLSKERVKLDRKVMEVSGYLYPVLIGDCMDCLHLAFAAVSGCDYLITCDRELYGKAFKIERILSNKGLG